MENNELMNWIKEHGYSDAEVKLVLDWLEKYDNETKHDAVMDSIGAGTFDLEVFVQQALQEMQADEPKA